MALKNKMAIPLSWLQLSHNKIRLLIALAGISFANILMFLQLGFRYALFESAVTLHKSFQGEIFLLSSQSTALIDLETFSHRRIYQSLAIEGVQKANSVYVDFAIWKNPVERNTRSIMVIGIQPNNQVLSLPGLEKSQSIIKLKNYILFDSQSREEFGPIAKLFYENKNLVKTEVNQQQVTIGGIFQLGTSFGADGNIITSNRTFLNLFPERSYGLINFGVLKLKTGADTQVVLENLRQKLPADVSLFSREEFIEHERSYWQNNTPIGFIFTLGTMIGLTVGIVIVYQILYTDISEHIPEYATLKAMGYNDIYFLKIVFQEAVILAVLGFIPGIICSLILYWLTVKATNLPIIMTLNRAIIVFLLTLLMCNVSGAIAVRKLQQADPADIF